MMPAVAIGTTLDGQRQPEAPPWRATVPYGQVELDCPWPAGATALRGAVVAALGSNAHIDHHNHLEDGTTRQQRATVYYRVRNDRPTVYAYGPRAADHLQAVARLSALRLPAGEVVEVQGATIQTAVIEVGLHKERWYRYQIRRYFPPHSTYARRPRSAGPERVAWAGQALTSAIRLVLQDVGIDPELHRPVHVHVAEFVEEKVYWRDQATRPGFNARFVSNAILPPGIGLGQHVSEGFGEVRPCL